MGTASENATKFAALRVAEEPLHALYEALRVIPTVPMIPRIVTAPEGLELPAAPKSDTKYWIPRGCMLMWNRSLVGTMGETFDIHRLKGITDRRLLEEAANAPFGEGKRKCVGNRLAELEVLTLLAELLSRVEVKPDPQGRPVA